VKKNGLQAEGGEVLERAKREPKTRIPRKGGTSSKWGQASVLEEGVCRVRGIRHFSSLKISFLEKGRTPLVKNHRLGEEGKPM